ncbi:MAG: CaiB/BaiF CoA transferase family protein [Acidimicrobiales bacterium]
MLSHYRVLDLTEGSVQLGGAILAALGAEVIAVEPPGGTSTRHDGPFAGDVPDPDRSLTHWAFNRGKRSVVADLAGSAEDRQWFLELVAGADAVLESWTPGTLEALGLGYEALRAVNPSIVLTSVTAFGQDGPKAGWAATDLTVWAAAGPLALTGDDDRAPVQVGVPQAFVHAGAEAAAATMCALYERGASGHGQHVDISAQQAAAQATQCMILATHNGATAVRRSAGSVKLGPLRLQLLWPCADGHVSITFLFGTAIGPATARLMRWVWEEGHCDEATRDKDWVGYGELLFSGAESVAEFDRLKEVVGAFCATKTKAELLTGALERRLLIAPVASMADVAGSPQLAERDYWLDREGIRWPGRFVRCTGTPLEHPGLPPALGADTAAVRAEPRRHPAASTAVQPAPSARPFEGLKVLDFMWVMAGPATTRVLADLGATVVRVESSHRVETARTLQPFKNDVSGLETSSLFASMNAGKFGITVDPSMPEGKAIIEDLVRWADVVTESFSPRAMRGWGLDYEHLRTLNPDLVMLSSCLFGQSGPLAEFAGYGTMAAALSGFFGITGWPDRAPCGPFGAYSDYISPRFSTAALVAALDHRRRTGRGQYLDFAQAEAAIHALAPALLQWTVLGTLPPRRGNDDPRFHPHGVYPAAGEDRWVAIACTDDAQRASLAALTGGLDDASIAAWTSGQEPDDATVALQAQGIPAHTVQNSPESVTDPQFAHRRHFRALPHPALGEITVEGPRARLSRTPGEVAWPGPTMGQHTMDVLTGILGYDDERITEVLISGATE